MLLLTLLCAAQADCLTLQASRAARGLEPPRHAGMLAPPFPEARPLPSPPTDEKTVYGGHMDHYIDSANFTVGWQDGDASDSDGQRASDAMEAAWEALIEDQGWVSPTSSDRYLIWVVLDPNLGSATGYTTAYVTDDYPDGYPVVFLNPTYASDEPFWAGLAMHEFHHTIQMTMRDFWSISDTGYWYWEASANYAPELVDPDLNSLNYGGAWYTQNPELAYDSTAQSHHYGMMVMNAFLEQIAVGPGAMKDAWERSATDADDRWDGVLAQVAQQDVADLWADFTVAVSARRLQDSDDYQPVAEHGDLQDGEQGSVAHLGTVYYTASADATLSVDPDDDVILGAPHGTGDSVQVRAGDIVGVTGLDEAPASYTLHLGESDGTGASDTGEDTGESSHYGGFPGSDPPRACGCGAVPRPPLALLWSLGALLALRRRAGIVRSGLVQAEEIS